MAIQNELKHGVNLTDLKWPSAIQDGINGIKLASNVMFILYCIGIAAAGVALLGAFVGIFFTGRFGAMVNSMLAFVSSPSLPS